MNDSMIRWVYMTAGDAAEASRLADVLVKEKLAACVNILGSIDSVYWWEGEVQSSKEIALLAKTTEARCGTLVERVGALHSYDCPCVVALPVASGNPAFLQWIAGAVGGQPVEREGGRSD